MKHLNKEKRGIGPLFFTIDLATSQAFLIVTSNKRWLFIVDIKTNTTYM